MLIFTLILSGCSLLTGSLGGDSSKEKKEKKKPGIEDFKAATEVEDMLLGGSRRSLLEISMMKKNYGKSWTNFLRILPEKKSITA